MITKVLTRQDQSFGHTAHPTQPLGKPRGIRTQGPTIGVHGVHKKGAYWITNLYFDIKSVRVVLNRQN